MTWRDVPELLDLCGLAEIARRTVTFVMFAAIGAASVWVGFRAFMGVIGQ